MDLPGETTYPVSVSGCVCVREKGMLSACGMVVLLPLGGEIEMAMRPDLL